MNDPTCVGCRRTPAELSEYADLVADGEYATANDAVFENEGTFNAVVNTFYCTPCYVKAGTPLGVAPPLPSARAA